MIYELQLKEFNRCNPLVKEYETGEARAVIEGNNPGRIFVDQIENPRSGLIWFGNNDGFCFIGDAHNERFNQEIKHFIEDSICPEAVEIGLEWFECFGCHSGWEKSIKKIFKNRIENTWTQYVYTLDNPVHFLNVNEPEINSSYRLVKITPQLLESVNLKNKPFLTGTLLEFWDSLDTFLQKGMGYAILFQNEVVSLCYTGFYASGTHCIGIETVKNHRQSGLASKVAYAVVKECLERNEMPYWDCMESNIPSNKTVQRLGLTRTITYTGFEFKFVLS